MRDKAHTGKGVGETQKKRKVIIYDKPKEPGFWDKNSLFDKNCWVNWKTVWEKNVSRSASDTLHLHKFRMGEGVKYKEGNYK